MTDMRESTTEEFVSVLSDAEDLLKQAGSATGERARDLRAQVEAKLLAAKLRLQEIQGATADRAKDAARYADDYVHSNPWPVIGVAAAVGFIAGVLTSRR